MHKNIMLAYLLGSATISSAYSPDLSWIPATKVHKLIRRDVSAMMVPQIKPEWHYYDVDGHDDNSFSFTLWHKDLDYVMLEELEPYVKVTCQPSSHPNATHVLTITFEDYGADGSVFEYARNEWERDDLLFIAHEPSCGDIDDRQIFKPLSKTFDTAAQTLLIDGAPLLPSTHEAASILNVRYGRSTDLILRHPKAIPPQPGNYRRSPEDVVIIIDGQKVPKKALEQLTGPNWDPFEDIPDLLKPVFHTFEDLLTKQETNQNFDIDWNPEWEQKESIFNLSSILSPTGALELSCVDCKAKLDMEATFDLSLHLDPKEIIEDPDDLDSWLKAILKEASFSLRTRSDNELRFQFEFLSSIGMDYWCNFPGTCGFSYHAAGMTFQDEGDFKDKMGNPKFKYPGKGGEEGKPYSEKNFPKKLGGLNFGIPDLGVGFWTDISVDGKVNITFPSFRMTVPADRSISLDLLAQDKLQENFDPHFEIGKPMVSLTDPTLQLSGAFKIGASIGIGSDAFKDKQFLIGARYDLVRVNFKASEKENVSSGSGCKPDRPVPKAISLAVEISTGLMAYMNFLKIFLNTGQLPFPLYFTWLIWETCIACPEDRCVSDTINEVITAAVDAIFGIDENEEEGEGGWVGLEGDKERAGLDSEKGFLAGNITISDLGEPIQRAFAELSTHQNDLGKEQFSKEVEFEGEEDGGREKEKPSPEEEKPSPEEEEEEGSTSSSSSDDE